MRKLGGILFSFLLFGCVEKVIIQEDFAHRVHKATLACVSASKLAKPKICADALLCQSTAQTAVDSLQAAQEAVSKGETDVAKEVTAASTRVIADVACKRGGW
jgi:prophage DNA circulation protein